MGVADSAGHTKPALVSNEDFPVADVEHWIGLKLKLELRGPDKLRVMPLAKQPSESIAEATARKQEEETMSDPVTQDDPVDGMTEFKLHRNEKNIEMVNAHNWRQDGRMMRLENFLSHIASFLVEKHGYERPKTSKDYQADQDWDLLTD